MAVTSSRACYADGILAPETTKIPEVDPLGADGAFAAGCLTELRSGRDLPTRTYRDDMGSWAVNTQGDNGACRTATIFTF